MNMETIVAQLDAAVKATTPEKITVSFDLFDALKNQNRIASVKQLSPLFKSPHPYEGILDGKYPIAVGNFPAGQHFCVIPASNA